MILQLHSQECELLYRDLTLKNRDKTIFENVSGKLGCMQMIALIGTSGAGKTSLLNSIAGRLPLGLSLTGSILVNGQRRDVDTWPRIMGYVEQEFYAYEYQTVNETFLFYVKLRLSEDNQPFVDELLNVLNLSSTRETRIANLSGGERKRVSIGVELVGNPSILFLDEPTSGLDSFNAINILETLNSLKSFGKSIMVTIHQPSSKMLEYFDSIILMAQGSVIYEGCFEGCIEFFRRSGYECPQLTNPSDFFLDTISLNTTTKELEVSSQKTINELKSAFASEDRRYEICLATGVGVAPGKSNYYSFWSLCYRNIVNCLRDTKYIKIQVLESIALLLIVGLTYLRLGYSQEDVPSRVGVIYFVLINTMFRTANPIFNVFPSEKKVIDRERKSGCYDGFSAFYSKVLSEMPFAFLLNIPYLAAVYWMVGLNTGAGRFFIYMLVQACVLVFSVSFSFAVSSVAPTQSIAQVLGTLLMITFILYGGPLANPNSMKPWISWIAWISPISYGFKASMRIILEDQSFSGSGDSAQQFRDGEDVLAFYGVSGIGVWPCMFVILGYALLYSVIGACALHYVTRIAVKMESEQQYAGDTGYPLAEGGR